MRLRFISFVAVACLLSVSNFRAQQVVQRGPLGTPSQVLDETEQWTTPLLLASDHDVQIYMPDISNNEWLKRNYEDYHFRGVYTLTLFTFYKTPAACRANQMAWGIGDAAHLNACIAIGYRVRRAKIDPNQKSVTLLAAAMVDQNGNVDPNSVETQNVFRTWDQLDANSQAALKKANALIAVQMKIYDERLQSAR
jgi:hypothetical protein